MSLFLTGEFAMAKAPDWSSPDYSCYAKLVAKMRGRVLKLETNIDLIKTEDPSKLSARVVNVDIQDNEYESFGYALFYENLPVVNTGEGEKNKAEQAIYLAFKFKAAFDRNPANNSNLELGFDLNAVAFANLYIIGQAGMWGVTHIVEGFNSNGDYLGRILSSQTMTSKCNDTN